MMKGFMIMNDPLYFEKRTLRSMIGIYCESLHRENGLCNECLRLQEYAFNRIDRCTFGHRKPACKSCPVHCYKPEKREEIRKVMRFAGPKMIYKHPMQVIIHLFMDFKFKKRSTMIKSVTTITNS
jgi:hypothetical protein